MSFIKYVYRLCQKHPDDFRIVMCIYVIASIITAITISHTFIQQIGTFLLEMAVCILIGLGGLYSTFIALMVSNKPK